MATSTQQDNKYTDEFGIERVHDDEPGLIDRWRLQWAWFDHVMLMTERYTQYGGNQFAAGITYFSVLSMFPLLMLVFAVAATILASRPELLDTLNQSIAESVGGSLGETLHDILEQAVAQRGAMFGIGGVTALWSGLNWVTNLRHGVSKMWNYPIAEGNFLKTRFADLITLVTIIVLFIVAIGVTAVGNSELTVTLLELVHLDSIPGINWIVAVVALILGLLANFGVFFWLIRALPRGEVPLRSAVRASVIGAVAFEIFKQLGAVFFASALRNPAGATFGPIIGVMVLFYFIWRILLYCSAWAATTTESLAIARLDAPAPAVIHVREEFDPDDATRQRFSIGLALGATAATVMSLLLHRS